MVYACKALSSLAQPKKRTSIAKIKPLKKRCRWQEQSKWNIESLAGWNPLTLTVDVARAQHSDSRIPRIFCITD
jgi:hypothetical protein